MSSGHTLRPARLRQMWHLQLQRHQKQVQTVGIVMAKGAALLFEGVHGSHGTTRFWISWHGITRSEGQLSMRPDQATPTWLASSQEMVSSTAFWMRSLSSGLSLSAT